jgi:hypothetical protein
VAAPERRGGVEVAAKTRWPRSGPAGPSRLRRVGIFIAMTHLEWLRWCGSEKESSGGAGLRATAWRRGLYGPNLISVGPDGPGVSLLPCPVGTH